MNEINNSMSGAGLLMGLMPGAVSEEGQGLGGALLGQGQQSGFVDLLDLISDMEVSESGSLDDSIGANLAQMQDGMAQERKLNQGLLATLSTQSLLASSNQAALDSGKMIGPKADVSTLAKGIDLQQMQLNGVDLEATAKLQTLNGQKANALSEESVAAWATAIAADDLKSVKVEPDLESQQAQGLLARDAKNQKQLSEMNLEHVSDLGEQQGVPEVAAKNLSKNQSQTGSQDQSAQSDQRSAKSSTVNEVAETRMTGSQFLLRKTAESPKAWQSAEGLRQTQTFHAKEAPAAVTGAAFLATHDDSRIATQSVSFVAEKVEALKAQGGGTLKVDLKPRELGAVEIQVRYNNSGELEIKVSAERPETVKALQGSHADLMGRIEKTAKTTQLEITQMSQPNHLSTNEAVSDLNMAAKSSPQFAGREIVSSQDILQFKTTKSMDNVDQGGAQENKIEQRMELSSAKTASDESSFQRDKSGRDSREHGLSRWEELIEKRKSA